VVLKLSVRARAVALVLVLAALCAGCLGARSPERLAEETPIVVRVVLEGPEGGTLVPPPAFVERLDAALRARNLAPAWAPTSDPHGREPTTTEARLAALRAASPGPERALLVEARVTFFSQIAGRYRWDVDVRATITRRTAEPDPSATRSETLGVAAFLQYAHEREPAALDFVARQVVSAIAGLVDRHLETTSNR